MSNTISKFTIVCWGCNKSETHPWFGPGEEYDAVISSLKNKGWNRRHFGPEGSTADPWFCSLKCAHESDKAIQAEEYWKNARK
jgi:hypothetical protein